MIHIDQARVSSLVIDALAAALAADSPKVLSLLVEGDADPVDDQSMTETIEGGLPTLRLERIGFKHLARQRTDREPDHAEVDVVLTITSPPEWTEASAGNLGALASRVAMVLAGQSLTHAGTGHLVDLREADSTPESDPTEERALGVVNIRLVGTVSRIAAADPSVPVPVAPAGA